MATYTILPVHEIDANMMMAFHETQVTYSSLLMWWKLGRHLNPEERTRIVYTSEDVTYTFNGIDYHADIEIIVQTSNEAFREFLSNRNLLDKTSTLDESYYRILLDEAVKKYSAVVAHICKTLPNIRLIFPRRLFFHGIEFTIDVQIEWH